MQKLSIPENINLQKEVIRFMSAKELRRCMIAVLPVLIGTVIYWISTDSPGARLISMAAALAYIFGCYGIFCRTEGNQSIYTFITRWIKFLRGQKFYRYKQEKEDIYLAESKRG